MRVHTPPAETINGDTTDLSIGKCDLAIELLIQTVVACQHCECTENLEELHRWIERRTRLKAIPAQRRGD